MTKDFRGVENKSFIALGPLPDTNRIYAKAPDADLADTEGIYAKAASKGSAMSVNQMTLRQFACTFEEFGEHAYMLKVFFPVARFKILRKITRTDHQHLPSDLSSLPD